MDLTRYPNVVILVLMLVITRIPMLNLGFGSNNDAWRVANSAFTLIHTGTYYPDRGLGYPFHELATALIYKLDEITLNSGWLLPNISTLIVSLISVILFGKILNHLNVKNKALLVMTFAFIPVIWINSTVTLDYMWSLMFILISWYFMVINKYSPAAVALGFAIGNRFTAAVLLVPFLYLLFVQKQYKQMRWFILISSAVSMILYIPVILSKSSTNPVVYAAVFSNFDINFTFLRAVYLLIYQFLGVNVFLFIVLVFLLNAHLKPVKDNNFYFIMLILLMYFIVYLTGPYKSAYLIPIIPFSLVLFERLLNKKLLILFCSLLIINGFISIPGMGYRITDTIDPYFSPVGEGSILRDIKERQEMMSIVNDRIDNHSVVLTGTYHPVIYYYGRYKILNGQWLYYGKGLQSSDAPIYIKMNDIYYFHDLTPDAKSINANNSYRYKVYQEGYVNMFNRVPVPKS